jgi:hypothetical protein
LLSIISEGNKFPDNYFWETEIVRKKQIKFKVKILIFIFYQEIIEFDEKGKTRNITKQRAILLLMSVCISRALVTTV